MTCRINSSKFLGANWFIWTHQGRKRDCTLTLIYLHSLYFVEAILRRLRLAQLSSQLSTDGQPSYIYSTSPQRKVKVKVARSWAAPGRQARRHVMCFSASAKIKIMHPLIRSPPTGRRSGLVLYSPWSLASLFQLNSADTHTEQDTENGSFFLGRPALALFFIHVHIRRNILFACDQLLRSKNTLCIQYVY